ncbi:response regulator [Mesoterricola silvestris]|uniref:Response regulatory domain-containing protein n=1 Tax=Mesoterricola silvestris TaxID=2927979 RepID=A0AA48K9P0_9BACT|nr:response regulator [Mesoterricola silvestris]BDU73701.1 hypothetical protein METEAL_28750 [Mesoterricola silvestris]
MARIMVVDDNPTASLFVANSLRPLGHEVEVVEPTCLFAVFQALHGNPPDLLITELVMPSCPGLTLLRFCLEDAHLAKVKIIVLTRAGDRDLGTFLQQCGNVHYLPKPVSPTALAQDATAFLEGRLKLNHGWDLACQGVVAVVDDSRMARAYHATCLRKFGFRPVEVDPAELYATKRTLEELKPDLVLLDYVMPAFTGEALLRAIRATPALEDTPVLVVTSLQEPELEDRLASFGGVGIANKPLSVEGLQSRVLESLGLQTA